ncbi:MAG: RAMP superfamily CRISPR-associated protein, partial [bacterium]|nr:RAMP superfamily CRISPR-associated protein [bacterium]
MLLKGKLYAESPIYRGNAKKTLFTRDDDGVQKLVSLAGEISGTAQALMDSFIGKSRDGKNVGLLNELWQRLYQAQMPEKLITRIECKLSRECYPADHFFDLRMGIKLDEDRWAAEANANYKMETLFRDSYFDLAIYVNDNLLKQNDNQSKLFYLLEELRQGRFWFGAGKSKGLGRCRLEMELPFSAKPVSSPAKSSANYLSLQLQFNAMNPILVGWNWGKIDPDIPAFAAIDGKQIIQSLRDLPQAIRHRLEMAIGGPIMTPEIWKNKFASYLPRVIAILLQESSSKESRVWQLPQPALNKLATGKFPLSKKIIEKLEPICSQGFPSKDAAEVKINELMGKKANLSNRVIELLEEQTQSLQQFDEDSWYELAENLGMDKKLASQLQSEINNENKLIEILTPECQKILARFNQQIDQQIKLLQSDAWIDLEIANREAHLKIKNMILDGAITENEWNDRSFVPEGIKSAAWQEFLESHANIQFRFLTNPRNLNKSIVNDRNHINFLKSYRNRTRQELSQPFNIDYRAGGPFNREISKKYGKPYDTLFMRMLKWKPSSNDGEWEIFVPGSTIKGAFRKRSSQVLKTLWGETSQTQDIINRLYGTQGKRALVYFSDAYLINPETPKSSWCAMDGVRMDPATGKPVEEAKSDYLYAYGENLSFQLRIDLQDVSERDYQALSVLGNIISDFLRGDIPIGGEKTNGFGWAQAEIDEIEWLTLEHNHISKKLFAEQELHTKGFWKAVTLKGKSAIEWLNSLEPIRSDSKKIAQTPPKGVEGFISHRYFGGYCGILSLEGEILTPISIKESGEASFNSQINGETVYGWDFFSISPPEASLRGGQKIYAIPSKTLRGMLRHVYTIASDSDRESANL